MGFSIAERVEMIEIFFANNNCAELFNHQHPYKNVNCKY